MNNKDSGFVFSNSNQFAETYFNQDELKLNELTKKRLSEIVKLGEAAKTNNEIECRNCLNRLRYLQDEIEYYQIAIKSHKRK